MAAEIQLDIVSDVMCPWCYIGKRRLETAIASMPDTALDIRWRPFLLDHTIPDDGMDRQDYLLRKFGSAEGIERVYGPVRAAGEAEGIGFRFDAITRSPKTINAHRMIRWSHSTGSQDAMVERLFQLYFLEGADLCDKSVLAGAGEDIGMERAVVERLLAGEADLEETRNEIALAQQMGVTGVPTFIIANTYAVIGAQSPQVLASAIAKAAGEAGEG